MEALIEKLQMAIYEKMIQKKAVRTAATSNEQTPTAENENICQNQI